MSIKDKIKENKIAVAGAAGTVAALAPTLAFAEGEQASSAATAINTMAGTIATDGVSMFTTVLPTLTPLLAFGILVGIGLRFVKRVGSKS